MVSARYPPDIGGLERYAHRVAVGVRDAHDMEVVAVATADRRRSDVVDGVEVARLPVAFSVSNTPLNPAWLWQLPRLLRELDVDVAHVHAPVPGLSDLTLLTARGIGTVFTYHSGSMAKGGSRAVDAALRAYERHLLPQLFRRADRLTAVSTTSLAHTLAGAALIPPGVDTDVFTPAPSGWAAPGGPPYLLYSGRLERTSAWKRVDLLISAYADLRADFPDLQLWLAGAGDAVADHRALAQTLGLDGVRFLGTLTGAELVRAYQNASVVVLPSDTTAESFGMCLLEAMACGVPVVGAAVGGPLTLVSAEVDGLLVPPGDRAALAAACRRLLLSPDLRRRMGSAGREKVTSRFEWDSRVAQYASLYEEVARRRK